MIDSKKLLADLQSKTGSRTTMVKRLEDDLRARCDADPAVDAPLQAQYDAARKQKRTALTYKAWRDEELTQIAVAWVLGCVLFANIRDLPRESLASKGDHWKVIIDYPFDERDHTIRDDVAKIEGYLSEEAPTRSICWLPCFFNHETLEALGTFVRLEQILKESQFPNYVQHLNEVDRETARNQLQSQRDQLRSQIIARLEMAYGILVGTSLP